MQADGFSLVGYSVAGEEAVVIAPELDCCFDIGKCPREALTVNHVLLTHGHMDHVAGMPYYFAQRDFQGIEDGVAIVPPNLVEPLEDLMRAWGRVEGHVPPHRFVAAEPGTDIEIRRGLLARPFATRHTKESLGYALVEVRQKLKAEYDGLTGPEIVQLKQDGVDVTRRVEMPLVAYLGDTAPDDYASLPCVADAKVLLIECTFFDTDHMERARAGRHLHVEDLPGVLAGMRNQQIVICHVTRRTNMSYARRALREALDDETFERIRFLMGERNHSDAEDA